MIFFPQKYSYNKDVTPFDDGVKRFSNVMIAGERAIILNAKEREIFFTKGSEYQMLATIARGVYHGKILDKRALCFPGFNHSNWYHVVADLGFQMFLAKQHSLVDVVVLPAIMKSFGESFLEFIRLFDFDIHFINHPRSVLKVNQALCFDKPTGRLSEAIRGGNLDDELTHYFEFLFQCFMNSEYVNEAQKYGEKIFSTRRGNDSRVYERVDEVESDYIAKGYQIVHFGGMNVFQQMAAMHNASHVSGFHGANLTNLLFAHKCKFVEELITRELSGDFHTIAKFKKAEHSRSKLI